MSSRNNFWFGTLDSMRWIRSPKYGADMSPSAWETSGTLLSGGGYARGSFGSHKEYTFAWPDSSSREDASLMASYFGGAYGRGLIYFVDPMIYDMNVLPSQWANPSVAVDNEWSHVTDSYPVASHTSNWEVNDLPTTSVTYNLSATTPGYRGEYETVFIPIPDGHALRIGAVYSATGTGAVFVSPVNANGTVGARVALTELSATATDLTPDTFSGLSGVRLWIGRDDSTASTVTISAMVARLHKTGGSVPTGKWTMGLGHSGCRFAGPPTYIANGGVSGGRIGYAATLVEVGDWV